MHLRSSTPLDDSRPLWRAMLVGGLTCLAVAWLLLIAIDALGITKQPAHSSYFIPAAPARSAAAWLGDVALMLGGLLPVVLGWTALFALIIGVAEQDGRKPVMFWLLAGFGAALAIALGLAVAREMATYNPKPLRIFLLFSVYACLPAMIGAHVARRFRHPAEWQ